MKFSICENVSFPTHGNPTISIVYVRVHNKSGTGQKLKIKTVQLYVEQRKRISKSDSIA